MQHRSLTASQPHRLTASRPQPGVKHFVVAVTELLGRPVADCTLSVRSIATAEEAELVALAAPISLVHKGSGLYEGRLPETLEPGSYRSALGHVPG